MKDLFEPDRTAPRTNSQANPREKIPPAPEVTVVPDGEWVYRQLFFASELSDPLLDRLIREIPWSLHQIRIFGRWVSEPRQTAWFGDPEAVYTYSGVTMKPAPWTRELQQIRREVETAAGATFNSVLLNLYRNGNDSMGWHADDEPELGANPVIASVSLGAERRFCLKHRTRPDERHELVLGHGSLLVMRGALQHHWLHAVPKALRISKPRLNLTFRKIVPARF